MQKLVLFLFLLVGIFYVPTATAQNTSADIHHQTSVYFDKDQSELNIEAQNNLTSMLQSIFDLQTYHVKIEAHTDSDGSLIYNQLLSEKRANAVYEFLLLQGLNVQDLQIVAQGETNPSFSNQTASGQQQNRRVDVFFVSKSAISQAKKSTQPKVESFEDLKRLTTTNTLQSFSINTAQEQKIEGRKGTILTIPPNAFALEDGSELPMAAKVEIELQEALQLEDMLLNNLSTKSGERFLETGGMVSIEANYQGQKLQLKSDKNIEVKVPKNGISAAKQKDMELFYGVAQEEGEAMDWKPTNEKVKTTPPHPKVEIDWSELENFEITKIPPPVLAKIEPKPQEPTPPKHVFVPIEPHVPQKDANRYKPPVWKKLFISRKKIDELSNKKHQIALAKYEARKAEYDRKLKMYEEREKTYPDDVEKYKTQLWEGYNTIYKNLAEIEVYRERLRDYNNYISSVAALRNLKNHIQVKGLRAASPSSLHSSFYQKYKNSPKYADFDIIDLIANNLKISTKEARKLWDERFTAIEDLYSYHLINLRKNYAKIDATKSIDDILTSLDSKYFEKKEEMGIFTNQDFDYFTASVRQMGWINIDRWLKQQEMQEVFVLAQRDENTRFFAISHKFNSSLSVPQKSKNGMISIELPIGEEFTIVGLKIEGGEFFLADKQFLVSKKELNVPLAFQPKTLADLKKRIRDIEDKRTISAPTP